MAEVDAWALAEKAGGRVLWRSVTLEGNSDVRVLAFPSGSNEVIAFGGPGLDAAWVVEACRAAGWQAACRRLLSGLTRRASGG